MSIAKRFVLVLVVLVSCVGCDQATKSVAQSFLSEAEVWSFLGDTVRLQVAYNPGAFLSLGASLPEAWRQGLLLAGVGGMLLCMLVYSLFARSATPAMVFAVALLLAGGASNLADRLSYGGYVVDFINIGMGPLRTGIFNVADVAISAGALILFADLRKQNKSV